MQLTDFDYVLPENLIAQEPAARREASRMLVVNRAANTFRDERFEAFPSCLTDRDVLVLNHTRVFPARLNGVCETGAKVEIFLIRRAGGPVWEALARPARRLGTGKKVSFGELSGTIRDNLGEGRVLIEFSYEGEFA